MSKKNNEELKIDFVVMWVDGNDVEWIEKKKKYKPEINVDDEKNRYRDWGLLRYWFRGIEKYAPWANKVYFITDKQVPDWLNVECQKLRLIDHSDYIDSKYLPLFNSSAIECTINKIEGLSETFVLFNDDFFLIKETKRSDFFRNGLPLDQMIENPIRPIKGDGIFSHILLNDMIAVEDENDKRTFLKRHFFKLLNLKYGFGVARTLLNLPGKRFSCFYNQHGPQPFLKNSFDELQAIRRSDFDKTLSNRFRSKDDITQYAIRYHQMLSGNFMPRCGKFSRLFSISEKNAGAIRRHIEKQKTKAVCLNDGDRDVDVELVRPKIIEAFEKILPNKSMFEK